MERREWVLCLTLCGNLVGLPTEQTDWENTFLNNQEYLSTVRVLEDVTRLPFIFVGSDRGFSEVLFMGCKF